jgi:hypothetical protein
LQVYSLFSKPLHSIFPPLTFSFAALSFIPPVPSVSQLSSNLFFYPSCPFISSVFIAYAQVTFAPQVSVSSPLVIAVAFISVASTSSLMPFAKLSGSIGLSPSQKLISF